MRFQVIVGATQHTIDLEREASHNAWTWAVGDAVARVDAVMAGGDGISLLVDGRSYLARAVVGPKGEISDVILNGQHYPVEVRDPRAFRSLKARAATTAGPRKLLASMPGKVLRVLVAAGTRVEAGQGLMVVEAMKMQNEMKSPKSGVVQKIMVSEGAAVNAGDVLAVIE